MQHLLNKSGLSSRKQGSDAGGQKLLDHFTTFVKRLMNDLWYQCSRLNWIFTQTLGPSCTVLCCELGSSVFEEHRVCRWCSLISQLHCVGAQSLVCSIRSARPSGLLRGDSGRLIIVPGTRRAESQIPRGLRFALLSARRRRKKPGFQIPPTHFFSRL